jgi:cytochrome c
MNKTLVLISFLFVLASCGNQTTDTATATSKDNNKESTTSDDPEVQKGLELVAKSDCFTCHKVEENYTGPAYSAVAERYKDKPQVIDTLVQKVIKGGAGNWGQVPMIAHPSISPEDARSMVKYVLSLKK